MATNSGLFRGHGAGAGGAAAGGVGEEADGSETQSSATYFISLNIPVEIIVSEGYCESRDIYL